MCVGVEAGADGLGGSSSCEEYGTWYLDFNGAVVHPEPGQNLELLVAYPSTWRNVRVRGAENILRILVHFKFAVRG